MDVLSKTVALPFQQPSFFSEEVEANSDSLIGVILPYVRLRATSNVKPRVNQVIASHIIRRQSFGIQDSARRMDLGIPLRLRSRLVQQVPFSHAHAQDHAAMRRCVTIAILWSWAKATDLTAGDRVALT